MKYFTGLQGEPKDLSDMKRLWSFVIKEFRHVLRDRKTLLILFGMPVVQILIFGFALSNEVKDTQMVILDQAKDESSRRLIEKISSSRYFTIQQSLISYRQVESTFKEGKVKLALVIPQGFDYNLKHGQVSQLQILLDASDPNNANVLNSYLQAIVQDFNQTLQPELQIPFQIQTEMKMMYNPQMQGVHNFVPGVMALVLMLVCVMMTSVAIVREKETGTMEILLVSPFHPLMVILSKAIPFLLISILNVTSILLLSVFVLDLPVNGSLGLLYLESILFIVTCLSLGIFISIQTSSQQIAMLISLMGLMLPTILFSGFMFPIENMPLPLQIISNVIPAKWFYIIVKSIMIKGLGFNMIWKETLILLGITLVLIFISLKRFKIRLA